MDAEVGTVLAVDDTPQNLELVEAILSAEGFEVRLAADGQAALEAVAASPPDCIVLDVMMPRVDGFTVCQRLKADRRTRTIPILLLTALSEVDDKVMGLEVGADDFLNKPVDQQELVARVRSLVKIKRLHDELDTSEAIIYSMARALDGKHPTLAGHSERVAISALEAARALGLSPGELDMIGKAAYLHDLGKIGVPEELMDADGPLDPDDRKLYEAHPELGDRILAPLRSFDGERKIIREHHERLNGSGYPAGISGDAFTLPSEIVAIANALAGAASRGSREEAAALLRGAVARGEFRRSTVEVFLQQPAITQETLAAGWMALLPGYLGRRTGTIIVADDTPVNRDLMVEYLATDKHRVIAVEGGAQLLEAVAREQPDVIVSDVRMPDVDGLAICHALKSKPETEFLPVVLITAQRDVADRRAGILAGADDFLVMPLNGLELRARVNSLLRMYAYFRDLEEHQHVILSLASALEAKHPYTRGHSERVGMLAAKLAREHGLDDKMVELMRVAGLLHDIGKIGVPERLLNKPGKLTPQEFQTIMTHPPRGEGICRPLRTVQAALPLIRHHHERFDGRGYPDHLKGEAIPLGARVLALADAFDALTSERSYRKTLPPTEAISILSRETTEGMWDPSIFAALERMLKRDGVLA
jgi:putative two-component system response regulator